MGAYCCKSTTPDYEKVPPELSHFDLLRSVGKGAFGKVRIVQHKRDHALYALKFINKERCIKMKAVENIIQERRLLEQINGLPFVCSLKFAFQDDENMFMVLELMLGGDLRFHLSRSSNGFNETQVCFIAAEIGLALEHLHTKRIVHRDIKPDNILLDQQGHAYLTDFNIAVKYAPNKPLTAMAGSLAYMAPEVLKQQGYYETCDWWSLGVVSYELLFKKRPFRAKSSKLLKQAIMRDEIRTPSSNVDAKITSACKQFLRMSLTRDLAKRLSGSSQATNCFRNHVWFAGLDWEELKNKRLAPPFIPDNKHINFDPSHEIRELFLDEQPLRARKRQNQPTKVLTPEQQAMETRFTDYDWTKAETTANPKKPSMPTSADYDCSTGGGYQDVGAIDRSDFKEKSSFDSTYVPMNSELMFSSLLMDDTFPRPSTGSTVVSPVLAANNSEKLANI